MKIVQILPTFSCGDAIGNHTLSLHFQFQKRGIESEIYAERIAERLKQYAKPIEAYQNLAEDIILYHMSTGSKLNRSVTQFHGIRIMYYHNITPPSFFEPYNTEAYNSCKSAYDDLKAIADKFDMVVGASNYNINELKKYGFRCPMIALPINIPFEDYKMLPNHSVIEKYKDGYTNIIFVGRIAPNKRQEKVIEDFFYYHTQYNAKSRLILVGNYGGMERYYLRLKRFVAKNHIEDVVFTGHIPFNEILAYYSIADFFLCESMHEGFCVPLVESMIFSVPVLAYGSSAIPETLGTGGIVHTSDDSRKTAEFMNSLLTDPQKLQKIKENQRKELTRFNEERMTTQLLEFIDKRGLPGNENG